jgi:hypothetical protein
MKYKTIDLDGYRLDGAVAKALGKAFAFARTLPDKPGPYRCVLFETGEAFCPSSDWRHGGPIIERERIALVHDVNEWDAHVDGYYSADDGVDSRVGSASGPVPLVAAMRAFVDAKHGAEVDL